MPIGDFNALISKHRFSRIIYKYFGVLDLHSHIRLSPIIKFFIDYLNCHNSLRILELGCGSGINAFEIYKLSKRMNVDVHYIGVDLSSSSIVVANNLLQNYQKVDPQITSKITFIHDDANVFLKKQQSISVDVVLLVDIIEHLKNPHELINLSSKCMNNDGIYVVSVPTPLYPKFFGKDFHAKIGHVIDGYTIEALNSLFSSINFRCYRYKYNTGIISNVGCWLYYNKFNSTNKYLNLLKGLGLYPFKYLDLYNSSSVSCSLFAIYKREGDHVYV